MLAYACTDRQDPSLHETVPSSIAKAHEKPLCLFPINDLPLELITEIFIAWAYVDEDGPWTAATTCHFWRTIALASGQVWSSIALRMGYVEAPMYPDDEDTEAPRRPLGLWIERSRTAPLSVHIQAHSTFPRFFMALYKALALLKQHSPRIQRLTLDVEGDTAVETILEILFRDSPGCRLHYLEVSMLHSRLAISQTISYLASLLQFRISHFWEHVPQADVLTFKDCIPLQIAPSNSYPVYELKLDGAPLDNYDLLENLKRLPSLKMLNLRRLPYASRKPSPNRLNMCHLVDLSLHASNTTSCSQLLDRLELPNLTSLSIGNYGIVELRGLWKQHEDQRWFDIMEPFGTVVEEFARRAPSLRFLRLHRCPVDDRHFLRILQAIPNLQELHLEFMLTSTPALRGLTPHPRRTGINTVLCPRLRRMHIWDCEYIERARLLDLLRSRCDVTTRCSPVEELSISWSENLEEIVSDVALQIPHPRPLVTILHPCRS